MSKTKNILISVFATFALLFGAAAIAMEADLTAFAAAEPTISKAYVTLNENIVVNYIAENVTGDTASMKFTYRGEEYTETATVEDGTAVFPFNKVTPQYLGETIQAELIVDGQAVDTHDTFTVQSYCEKLLDGTAATLGQSEPENAAMRALVVDLLYYGAAAQEYTGVNTDDLATKGLSDEEAALKTTYTTLTKGDRTLTGAQSEKFYWKGAGLRFDYNVSLYFTIAVSQEITDLSMTVDETKITEFTTEAGEGVTYYTARYTAVSAMDFDKVYTATVYEGETAIGKAATYSVKSYVYAMQNDADMASLVRTAYNYGKSAVNYANSIHDIIVTTPDTVYNEGEFFNTANVVVQTVSTNGTVTQVLDYDYSPKTALTEDVTEITVTYGGVSKSLPITVNPVDKALFVTTNPTKMTYTAGENFDAAGMVITLKEGDTTTVLSADEYTVTGGENLQIGSEVIVSLNADNTVTTKVPVLIASEINVTKDMVTGGFSANHATLGPTAVNGDYANNFEKDDTLTLTVNSTTAGKAGITVKASSSWVTEYSSQSKSTWYYPMKVEDVRANTVFEVYVNGVKVPMADDVWLTGGETSDPAGDIYLLAKWSYVKLANVDFIAGDNEIKLVFLEQIYKNADVTVNGDTKNGVWASPNVDTVLVNFGECNPHNTGTTYYADDTQHWHVCTYCSDKVEVTAHTYDQKNTDGIYKDTDATCVDLATYYYSCVCGRKGTETFEHGDYADHVYEAKAADGNHWHECTVCHDVINETSEHTYVDTVTEADGVQTLTRTCICGNVITKTLNQTDANYVNLTADNLAGTNTIAWAAGDYATRTSAEVKNTGSATVQQALNKSTNGDYITFLYGGSRIEVATGVTQDTTGTIVVKASSGWINNASWDKSTAKTGDMQFNLVFKAYIRHSDNTTTEIAVDDSVILKGATGNYSIMANWNYVTFADLSLKAGDTFVLESLTPTNEAGQYLYWDGATSPQTKANASVSKGNTQSTPNVDTVALYID